MSEPVSPLFTAITDSIRLSIETAAANDLRILSVLDQVSDRIIGHDAELEELREGVVALSNRIEALTQAGLHSVKVPQ